MFHINDHKTRIMIYNSNCIDLILNLPIQSSRELDAVSFDIFYLTLTLSQLKIFVSRKDKHVCPLSFSMEQRAVMRFFTLKRFIP
jgi:hypothetical protein